jgi:hypothetical protein
MNKLYPKYKKKLLNPGTLGTTSADAVDFIDDDIKMVLVDSAFYTYSDTHEFLSDVPVGARVATSPNLTGKTASDGGVADCDDVTFASVTGASFEYVITYKDTGTAATSSLICFEDTAASGLPTTPNSGPIQIGIDNGSSKLFII